MLNLESATVTDAGLRISHGSISSKVSTFVSPQLPEKGWFTSRGSRLLRDLNLFGTKVGDAG